MEKLKNTRILGAVGLACLFLGIILPYLTISIWGFSQSISLWGYWEGKVMMVLTFANLLFIFKDYIQKYVPQLFNSNLGRKIEMANPKMSLIPTVLVAAFTLYLTNSLNIDSSYVKHGLGFWMLWGGVVCLILHAVLYKGKENAPVNNTPVYNPPINNVSPMNNVNDMNNASPMPNAYQNPMPGNMNMGQPVNYNQVDQNNVSMMANNQQPMSNTQTPPTIKFCPSCGNKVEPGAQRCTMCGRQF